MYLFTLAKFAKALDVEFATLVLGGNPTAESQATQRRIEVDLKLSVATIGTAEAC